MTHQQQERRALNEGIEDTFIETSRYAAGIQTYYAIRRGTIKDIYEEFYFNLAWLLQLTEGLQELAKEKEAILTVKEWLCSENGDTMQIRCETGIKVFSEFKSTLSAKGLLALPSRSGR
jgi:hypothetical protein